MVAKPPTPQIQALIQRSHLARENLGQAAQNLRSKLDAPARARESLRAHPGRWLAGATASGLIASRLLFRRPKAARPKKNQSLSFFILKLVANTAMPAVKIWLLAQIKAYLSRRASGPTPPFPI